MKNDSMFPEGPVDPARKNAAPTCSPTCADMPPTCGYPSEVVGAQGLPTCPTCPTSDSGKSFRIRISTATLPGLIQTYALAEERLYTFIACPDRLQASLENPSTNEQTAFLLQQGAKALNALECLREGTPDALEYLGILLGGLTHDLYKRAENLGRAAL